MDSIALVHRPQGGNKLVVESGGEIEVKAGGLLTINGVTMSETNLSGVTADAAEINKLDGLATTALELGKLNLAPFLVTTTSATPASGSNAAQFVVKNAAGVAVAVPVNLRAYLTTSATGLTHNAANTSIAVLTNGALTTEGATPSVGPFFTLTTTAAGLIGVTVTAAAGTYYIAFIMPNGKLVMSDAIVVDA